VNVHYWLCFGFAFPGARAPAGRPATPSAR
jgi:hypothetical protein